MKTIRAGGRDIIVTRSRYHWRDKRGAGWAIFVGVSLVLLAEGPGWSRPLGRALLGQLRDAERQERRRLERRRVA